MSFPIIGGQQVWENWNDFGSGSWRMWFMAPYGSWLYAAFVKGTSTYFKKIDIGGTLNYSMYDWDFGVVLRYKWVFVQGAWITLQITSLLFALWVCCAAQIHSR